ncbi:hypothetical protein [Marinobacter mobilis]|uniref:hypothetical protein n=1 Tax=Marinobacter mobilis TaxID=488533 RepID=UPI0035C683A3
MRYRLPIWMLAVSIVALSGCSSTSVKVQPYVATEQDAQTYETMLLLRQAHRFPEANELFSELVAKGYPPALREQVNALIREDQELASEHLVGSALADSLAGNLREHYGYRLLLNWAAGIQAANSGVCQKLEGYDTAWYHRSLRVLAQQGDLSSIVAIWNCEKRYTRPPGSYDSTAVELMEYVAETAAYPAEYRMYAADELFGWHEAQLIYDEQQRDAGLMLLATLTNSKDHAIAGMAQWTWHSALTNCLKPI